MNKNLSAFLILLAFALPAATSRAKEATSVYVTAKDTDLRMSKTSEPQWVDLAQPLEKVDVVFVDPAKQFQTIVGIGGALTDAAAETFYKLPLTKQQQIMTAYFDPIKGLGYSLGRTNINSCDFSSDMYTYVAVGDKELKTFNIDHDRKFKLPFLKQVLATAGKNFTLYASPWSPPAWMKDNNDVLHGGALKPEFYASWANYFANFIEAYAKEGVPVWGITVQNEPMAVQPWESCVFTAQQERDFVKNHLGPTMVARGHAGTKIIVWDHNRTMMYQRAETILDDPEAAKYIWGVGFHWYVTDTFTNVQRVKEAFPAIHLMHTEGCFGPFDPAKLADWQWGEGYGKAMAYDFNNGAEGWTDWNVLLDETGGPNHVANFCYAPVIGFVPTGEVRYMSSFYYIGHFSKFVRPGAKRIISSPTVDNLLSSAFLNPDGSVVVIVQNETAMEHPFMISIKEKAAALTSLAHSIMTVVIPGN